MQGRHEYIVSRLAEINQRYGVFADVRGLGLLIGAELSADYSGMAREFLAAAVDSGLMLLNAGPSVLRFAPSLVIPMEDLQIGMERLENAVKQVAEAKAK